MQLTRVVDIIGVNIALEILAFNIAISWKNKNRHYCRRYCYCRHYYHFKSQSYYFSESTLRHSTLLHNPNCYKVYHLIFRLILGKSSIKIMIDFVSLLTTFNVGNNFYGGSVIILNRPESTMTKFAKAFSRSVPSVTRQSLPKPIPMRKTNLYIESENIIVN